MKNILINLNACRPSCQCYELLIRGSAMQYVYRFENEPVKVFESTEI